MASAFAHALIAATASGALSRQLRSGKILIAGIACAIVPDLDVLGFYAGIPYNSTFGHRGFTHSILFALALAAVLSRSFKSGKKSALFIYFFSCTISHAAADMITNGGLGVALFAPFSNERCFFPLRPVQVSPLGVSGFFSERGLKVIFSEALWIGVPCALAALIFKFAPRRNERT